MPRLARLSSLSSPSSLGSRGNAGRAEPGPQRAPGTTGKRRHEGLRGALGVVGVVGLLSVVGVLVTLGVVNGSDDGGRDDASVSVATDDRGSDVIDALDGASAPPTSASTGPSGKKTDASKESASATPSTGASHKSAADPSPDADTGTKAGSDTPPRTTTSVAVPGVNIFSHDSNRCIDIVGGKAVQGAKLMIWDCSQAASQQWTFTGGTMRALGMCVQLAGGSTDDGIDLEIGSCNGGAAQRFALNTSHDVVSALADKCADVRDHQKTNGSRIQLWSCTGLDNQKWSVQ
ncbi:ricin-type beta-trefoil lectin domain protein [Streptomyces justiciae]|uniref:ricin-type beta-trefoil lectin domain protein n=1 Tax=Streptomyces justiciae TaxID=2780140 RepID=UPI002119A43E|nr:ricin-type beta-trefoil lectin domain protein [Streptomyces justiciae]MCW8383748.1 ricin-type beta-trefoil lectin domain protein [Streptomyces justiciae]